MYMYPIQRVEVKKKTNNNSRCSHTKTYFDFLCLLVELKEYLRFLHQRERADRKNAWYIGHKDV